MQRRCVVVGAGISGLAVAHALEERGVEPLVLEADTRAGGKIRSERFGGFLVEHGPAGFYDRGDPAIARLLGALGLGPVEGGPVSRRRLVLHGRRTSPLPSSPRSFLESPVLDARAKLRALCDLVLPRGPLSGGQEESLAGFGRRRLGRRAAERLLYPLVSGLYAGDPERISAAPAFPQLARLEREHRSLLVGVAREERRPQRLVSFAEGLEELPRALAARLGDRLRLGVRLAQLRGGPGAFRVAVEEQGEQYEIEAPAVVLAVPAHAAASAVVDLAPDAGLASASIGYVPVTLVYLGYPASALPRPLEAYGFLVPPGEPSRLLGAVFSSAVLPARAPEGTVLVMARLGGARDPEIATLPADEVARIADQELRGILGITAPPRFVELIRHERGLPQYTLGHARRVADVDAAEQRLPGIYFAGNAYRGLGIPDCIRAAPGIADRVAARLAS